MPRSRMIKPEFWDDQKLCSISLPARLIFIGLWTYSDDYGVVKGNAMWLKNKILPYDGSLNIQGALTEPSGSAHGMVEWLAELEKIRCIIPFEYNGENYYYIRNFTKYQKVNRPSKTRNPKPPEKIFEDSVRAQGVFIDETETETETKTETKTETETAGLSKLGKRSTSTDWKEIESLCDKITQLPPQKKCFDPQAWSQEKINGYGHPKAVLHCLNGLILYWDTIKNPWGWCNDIFDKQNGNYNERDAIATHESYKKMPVPNNLSQILLSKT